MANKPSLPKGTRDFSPIEVARRTYIINTIKKQFELFGFQPIETPSFENSDTLLGKYGEEGDRLIFKILNSGDFEKKADNLLREKTYLDEVFNESFYLNFHQYLINKASLDENSLTNKRFNEDAQNLIAEDLQQYWRIHENDFLNKIYPEDIKEKIKNFWTSEFGAIRKFSIDIIYKIHFSRNNQDNLLWKSDLDKLVTRLITKKNLKFSVPLANEISDKALRYDLTVPFARYVVQHQNEIIFPFKRYQIQPVWRADQPQKGRFREFYQCDADAVGSTSLWQEVEYIKLYDAVFTELGLKGVTIKINNRKILSGIAEVIGESDKLIDFTVALDKLDKIGVAGVTKEMLAKGISSQAIEKVEPLLHFSGSFDEKLDMLTSLLTSSEEGLKGIEEVRFIYQAIQEMPLQNATFELDVTLARGLNYYTGAIFEVAAPYTVKLGSIGGGGRYDDLTDIFGKKDISGMGISFGLDRIYLVLEELGLFPETLQQHTQVLFINFGDKEALYAMKAVNQLRTLGIKAELYPDAAKMNKQMKYCNKREIPFVVLAGDEEMQSETYTVKNMKTGEQSKLNIQALVDVVGV
ncbi:histidine--tRNA ligase [Aquimarina sp. ERC-38]|uniref:histidine--tRNA ligase n=1 Tax=Aquimarina sp. ERC-38 TaxID=2949996 RepID=UPI002247FFD0|nr:histidine--tRNA ligase [Aquimarina sp. ERC-38]UZO80081.1 histidine--tRNA ligase [Aquimarina sp. ERC-38]